ncbi:hypothetical protein GCM10011504_04560 [Siccirubricoccus deserti]|uniref:Uncharacterized protein n=1 Tax=Siccirubricoccus deserti TaxID=2013562 RepID=A0A9X0UBY3_9PROT|nr:hypothetical protein [Siccirubricoccus deserti]MBC4013783.1 hypothetical protein [Siccirubricoccus deserti]GGC29418.1 hypothetical protein GCM10011504_04560 [Siccirubricoccus deserti]
MMIDALIHAGQRLAEALRAENEALAALDMPRAAGLASAKLQASDAFAAACAAATRLGGQADGPSRRSAEEMAARLQRLGAENRALLERAIAIQARVIETIAGAALPKAVAPGYGAMGRPTAPRSAPAIAVATRA